MKLKIRKQADGVEKYGSASRPTVIVGACWTCTCSSWCCWLSGMSNMNSLDDPDEL